MSLKDAPHVPADRLLVGKVMQAIAFFAEVTAPDMPYTCRQDIHERCQELLKLESAREAAHEWQLLWDVAYYACELYDGFLPHSPAQEAEIRAGWEAALEALRQWSSDHFWQEGDPAPRRG
jgi:hypothetical protein